MTKAEMADEIWRLNRVLNAHIAMLSALREDLKHSIRGETVGCEEEGMNKGMLARMVKLAKEYSWLKDRTWITGIDANKVHISEILYRDYFPDYKEHKTEVQNMYVRVSCIIDGVEFFSLFTPALPNGLKDLI